MPDAVDARRRLRLVAEAPSGPRARRGADRSLAAAPFRPGELPVLHWVRLAEDARRSLHARAAEARLPTELWLRIAVEASRVLVEIAELTGYDRNMIVAALDLAASEPHSDRVEALSGGALRRYGEGLKRGTTTSAPADELALRLSEEIAAAWGHAAAAERAALPAWIAKQLDAAPTHCVRWEAAAARTGRTLAEWAYASFLRRAAISTA